MPQAVIAVIGGTGFIGRHLLERLAADSPERVRVFVHELAPSWLESLTTVEVVRGDLLRPATLGPLLADATSVINLAGQVSAEIDDYQRVNLCGPGLWEHPRCHGREPLPADLPIRNDEVGRRGDSGEPACTHNGASQSAALERLWAAATQWIDAVSGQAHSETRADYDRRRWSAGS